jgi:hypothetical protein
MDAEQLRAFADFESLPPATLEMLALRSRAMRLPPGRWLVRPGRSLGGRLYLLEGRLRLDHGNGWSQLAAGDERARHAVYPGCTSAQTLTGARLLRFDVETAAWLDSDGPLGVPEVALDESSWQCRFLASPFMQRLTPAAWQRILRAMTAAAWDAGEEVVQAGAPADHCFVLCKGRAEVREADGAVLAHLGPGDLFGEEALITGAMRNATVRMTEPGATVSLAADRFERWILREVVVPASDGDARVVISLDGPAPGVIGLAPAALRQGAQRLAREQAYAVTGASPGARYLAAFLLIRAGIDARPRPG